MVNHVVENLVTHEVLATGTSSVNVTNSIFWGNTTNSVGPQITVASGDCLISYSDVQGSGGSSSWSGLILSF